MFNDKHFFPIKKYIKKSFYYILKEKLLNAFFLIKSYFKKLFFNFHKKIKLINFC